MFPWIITPQSFDILETIYILNFSLSKVAECVSCFSLLGWRLEGFLACNSLFLNAPALLSIWPEKMLSGHRLHMQATLVRQKEWKVRQQQRRSILGWETNQPDRRPNVYPLSVHQAHSKGCVCLIELAPVALLMCSFNKGLMGVRALIGALVVWHSFPGKQHNQENQCPG